ncbi:MAG: PfkB family carbohydrate kinase [Candidatus Neomarinimicrobiota bacterium]|jgi:sugar/nucleoside kinase (ribokinase family)
MSLLVVGSIALDTVITPKGRSDEGVGGSATFISLAAEAFTPVSIVGIVGDDFPQEAIEEFKKRNIDLRGLEVVKGKTFRWAGEYRVNMKNRETLYTDLNVFADFDPHLPESYRRCPFLFLGNIHPELQLKVLDQMENKPLVGLDSMNLWIETTREKLNEVLSKVDIVILNDEEIIQMSGLPLAEGVKSIQKLGPKTVIAKKGNQGAELFYGEQHADFPICPEEELVDPTGAGDTFAGGFMGYLAGLGKKDLDFEDYKNAVVNATVMASFLVESFSTKKICSLSKSEIEDRTKMFIKLMADS